MNPIIATELIRGIFGIVKDKAARTGYIGITWVALDTFVQDLTLKLPWDNTLEYYGIMGVIIGVPIITPVSWWESLAKKAAIVKTLFERLGRK